MGKRGGNTSQKLDRGRRGVDERRRRFCRVAALLPLLCRRLFSRRRRFVALVARDDDRHRALQARRDGGQVGPRRRRARAVAAVGAGRGRAPRAFGGGDGGLPPLMGRAAEADGASSAGGGGARLSGSAASAAAASATSVACPPARASASHPRTMTPAPASARAARAAGSAVEHTAPSAAARTVWLAVPPTHSTKEDALLGEARPPVAGSSRGATRARVATRSARISSSPSTVGPPPDSAATASARRVSCRTESRSLAMKWRSAISVVPTACASAVAVSLLTPSRAANMAEMASRWWVSRAYLPPAGSSARRAWSAPSDSSALASESDSNGGGLGDAARRTPSTGARGARGAGTQPASGLAPPFKAACVAAAACSASAWRSSVSRCVAAL